MRPVRIVVLTSILAISAIFSIGRSQTQSAKALSIYVIDVEGGNSTLFVAPSGESLLIDTGNLAAPARDVGRIMEAVKDAGLRQIDHLITTHWHVDHAGGLVELSSRIPVREYLDHGPNIQPDERIDNFLKGYPALYAKSKHTVSKAGDRIAVQGIDVRVVASAGNTIKAPLAGAGKPNPYCASFKPGDNNAEDPQSVAVLVTYGKFRALHPGDLTKNKEFELMCPINRIGVIDVLLGLHHGRPSSSSEVFVHALEPRAAIMNNGTRKGGDPEVMKILHSSPRLEDLWQLHFSVLSGQEYTVPGMFIANLTDAELAAMPIAPVPDTPGAIPPAHEGKAYWIKVSAQADGTFTITNARNGFSKTYPAGL